MHSMTGFGRGAASSGAWNATLEISGVNRKQAEVVVQGPRELNELETTIRQAVLGAVSRGRIQVNIALERAQGGTAEFYVDPALAKGFAASFGELEKLVGYPVVPAAGDFLRQPGLITAGGGAIDATAAWSAIEPALTDALTQFVAMRRREGEDLKADLLKRLNALEAFARNIETLAPARPARQRELLLKRLRDMGLDFNPTDERVIREIALFADRCDISEEITRLDSHFGKFREYLDAAAPPGRPLDFLCQELFREFNTIGSKATDAVIAQNVVEAKTELEKIREQVQNVE